MKKKLSVICALSVTLALTACGSSTEEQAGDELKRDVALILGTKGSPFFEAVKCGAQERASELDLNLTVSAPDSFNPDQQIPVVQAVKASAPPVAVLTATDVQALINPVNDLIDSGTEVIMYDQTIGDTSKLTAQIIADNEEGGRLAAKELAEAIGEKGAVITIAAPPGSAADDGRRAGFDEEIANYPDIVNLGPQYHVNDPQKVAQIINSTLAANPDFAGVFATGDQGVIGALTGVRQADAFDQVQIVGYDAATAEVDALKNGEIAALIAQNPHEFGTLAMEAAAKVIEGVSVDTAIYSELVVIKRGEDEKADKYEYKGSC